MLDQKIGSYRIIAQLGQGGMGVVYLAEHTVIGRKVVIKILRPEYAKRPDLIQRFFNEARAPNAVEHPDIVEIYDVGTTPDGAAYLVMELLKGRSLGALLDDETTLPEVTVRAIGTRMARALHAAHEAGIIHRDLKPENVFIVPDPDKAAEARVKLLDFGIAKLMEEDMKAGVETGTGAMLGTPAYMSPEQCQGAKHVEARSDIYSLGVMLYHMLVGTVPFRADTLGALLVQHLNREPDPLRQRNPRVSEAMETIVLKCLKKDPGERFQSMAELAEALSQGAPGGRRVSLSDSVAPTSKIPAQQEHSVALGVELAGTVFRSSVIGDVAAGPTTDKDPSPMTWASTAPETGDSGGRAATGAPASGGLTTLGSGAGELTAGEGPRRRLPLGAIVAGAVVAVALGVGLGVWFFGDLGSRGDESVSGSEGGEDESAARGEEDSADDEIAGARDDHDGDEGNGPGDDGKGADDAKESGEGDAKGSGEGVAGDDGDMAMATATPEEGATPATAAKRPVILRIESKPRGAAIFDVGSGEKLGDTPYELETHVGAPRPKLRVTLKGYKEAELSLPTDRSDTRVVKLKPRRGSPRTSAPGGAVEIE